MEPAAIIRPVEEKKAYLQAKEWLIKAGKRQRLGKILRKPSALLDIEKENIASELGFRFPSSRGNYDYESKAQRFVDMNKPIITAAHILYGEMKGTVHLDPQKKERVVVGTEMAGTKNHPMEIPVFKEVPISERYKELIKIHQNGFYSPAFAAVAQ